MVTHSSRISIDQPSRGTALDAEDVPYRSDSFEGPLYYGARLAVFPFTSSSRDRRVTVGFELEYIHGKVKAKGDARVHFTGTHLHQPIDSTQPFNTVIDRFEISHGLNFLFANIVVRQRLDDSGRARLLLRGGAGPTIPHVEVVLDGESRHAYQWGRPAIQAAAGLETAVGGGLGMLAEVKCHYTPQRIDIAGGTASARFASFEGVIGVTFGR